MCTFSFSFLDTFISSSQYLSLSQIKFASFNVTQCHYWESLITILFDAWCCSRCVLWRCTICFFNPIINPFWILRNLVNDSLYHDSWLICFPINFIVRCLKASLSILCFLDKVTNIENIKIAICQTSTADQATRFMIHAVKFAPINSNQPRLWFEIPKLIESFIFEAMNPEIPGIPLRIVAVARVGKNHELISISAFPNGNPSVRSQRMASHSLKHLAEESRDRCIVRMNPYFPHPTGDCVQSKTLVAVSVESTITIAEIWRFA